MSHAATTDHLAELKHFLSRIQAAAARQPVTRPFAFLIRTAADILRDATHQRDTQHRQAYAQLMLAETELQQLRAELADSPRNAAAHRPTAAIGSILERIYAAKGILAALLLLGIVHAEISPYVDDPIRRRETRPVRVTARKIEETASC